MKSLTTRSKKIQVPENLEEDNTIRFDIKDLDKVNDYYLESGYVIIKNIVSKSQCNLIKDL